MFAECPELKTIIASRDKWSLESIDTVKSDNMFKGSTKLVGGNGTVLAHDYLRVKMKMLFTYSITVADHKLSVDAAPDVSELIDRTAIENSVV